MERRFIKKIIPKRIPVRTTGEVVPRAGEEDVKEAKKTFTFAPKISKNTIKKEEAPVAVSLAEEVISEYTPHAFTLKADAPLFDYGILDLPDPDYVPALKEITGVDITFLTSQEIENMATFQLTTSKLSGPGSIYDPRSGPIVNHEQCVICSLGWKDCQGHPFFIKFPYPLPHPMRLKQLAERLTCVCEFCHRIVVDNEQIRTLNILRYKREHRFNAFLDVCKKQVRCQHCRQPHGKYTVIEDKFYKIYKKKKSKPEKLLISYAEVVEIVSNIRESESKLLGFSNALCHPNNMIMYNMYGIPSNGRPFIETSNNRCVVAGTMISLTNGTAVPIESMDELGYEVHSWDRGAKCLMPNFQSRFYDHGKMDCVTLTMTDGRTITCTPDHKFLTEENSWVEARNIELGVTKIKMSIDNPKCPMEESKYQLEVGEYKFDMGVHNDRQKAMALCRLMGYVITDGSRNEKIFMGCDLDMISALADVKLVTGKCPKSSFIKDAGMWTITFPKIMAEQIGAVIPLRKGSKVNHPMDLPKFIFERDCPTFLIREFIAGMFGGDGIVPRMEGIREGRVTESVGRLGIIRSKDEKNIESLKYAFSDLAGLIEERFEVKMYQLDPRMYDKVNRHSQIELATDKYEDMLRFIENIGFRHCIHKQLRSCAIACFIRYRSNIIRQNAWIIDHAKKLYHTIHKPYKDQEKNKAVRKLSLKGELLEVYESVPKAVEANPKASSSSIYKVCQGKKGSKTSGGFKWEFVPMEEVKESPWITLDELAEEAKKELLKHEPYIDPEYVTRTARIKYALRNDTKEIHMSIDSDKFFEKTGLTPWIKTKYVLAQDANNLPTFYMHAIDRKIVEEKQPVYDITVDVAHSFVSNGILAANSHDDLSHKHIDIYKITTKLAEKGVSEKTRGDLMDALMFHVKTFMDNSKNKARDPGGKRPLKAIKQRLAGKQGHIRSNVQGKRTGQAGRSVISPDPDLHVNEVGMPREIADKLTFPERVNALNLKHCQHLLDTGRVNHIHRGKRVVDARFAIWTTGFKLEYTDKIYREGRVIDASCLDFKVQSGDSVQRTECVENADGTVEVKRKLIRNVEPPRRKQYSLRIGDVIERKLQDGDWVVFNRQPTERSC